MNLTTNDVGVTFGTPIIQVETIDAAIIYFWRDLVGSIVSDLRGVLSPRDPREGAAARRGDGWFDPDRGGWPRRQER
jgi:hypothetical protein